MFRKNFLSFALAGMFACVAASASAQATITNQPVFFTFDKAIAVPGMTLPAGEYEFRLATTRGGDREVVEIFDRATAKHMITVGAIATTMSDLQGVPEKPAVRFYEVAANAPSPVRNWWYPGIHGGHQFIYSRAEAQAFVKHNTDGVLIADGNATTVFKDSAEVAVVADAAPARVEAAVEAPTMARAEAEVAPVRQALPRTASARPYVTAFGLLALFAGLGLAVRRRVA
jgi:hypothetical protein